MNKLDSLKDFLDRTPPTVNRNVYDGAPVNPNQFPLYGVRLSGTILFADLPGYSKYARGAIPEECAFMVNHFFAWIEASANRLYGGVIDKFIGDEVMIIFAPELGSQDPLKSAMLTARKILEHDEFSFDPKIGIASGELIIAAVGTRQRFDVSALGHTVNLAARCVGKAEPVTIKAATDDRASVEELFSDKPGLWKIDGPSSEEFKNIGAHQVITVRRLSEKLMFDRETGNLADYLGMVRELVAQALSNKR